jgi:hypothetical protein
MKASKSAPAPKKVPKSEDEKTLRGTVSLFKNELNGMRVYLRGKKIFLKSSASVPTRQVDTVEAGYSIRREYALITGASPEVAKKYVTIHPKLAKCKWGAEASLKLDKMIK